MSPMFYISSAGILLFMLYIVVAEMWNNFTMMTHMDLYALGGLSTTVSLALDWKSLNFMLVVCIISMSVLIYSNWYMNSELNTVRFMLLVLIFVLSMLILISSSSFMNLLVGWDGLGLSSYFLVIYFDNYKSNTSGLVTVISNRVGDVFIILSGVTLFINGSSWFLINTSLTLFGWLIIFILLAAITKSAMYPYCVWLPEAMAAPTPVSSLVHSSTLVTAGVFLILRFYSLVGGLELELITMFGSFTLLISGLGAMYCMDYKKVVALSTLSQLAFMIISIGVGAPSIALFHLLTHALFKSSLFMSVGGFIHFSSSNQDPRHSGSYLNSWGEVIGVLIPVLSMAGMTALSGFMSKEMIILQSISPNISALGLFSLSAGVMFTLIYSARLILSMVGPSKLISSMIYSDTGLNTSSVLLVGGSIMYGSWLISNYFMTTLVSPSISVSWMVKMYFIMILLWGMWEWVGFSQGSNPAYSGFMHMKGLTCWWGPVKMNSLYYLYSTNWDKGVLELFGPQWAYSSAGKISSIIMKYSANQFQYYLWVGGACVVTSMILL